MSYVFGNNEPYDYDLYTTGGQTASVNFSSLIQTAKTNYVIIVDISNTIQGTYSYSVNGGNPVTLTKGLCPFLISDISGLTDISCSITFTPSENRDGYGSIFYYTVSRYTPLVKTQIRLVSNANSVVEQLFINNYGYEPFQKMSTQLYSYYPIAQPDRIILLPNATISNSTTYFNTTGTAVLNNNGTLNTTWSPSINEFGYGPRDDAAYNNTNYYYNIPLIIEKLGIDSYTVYRNENLIVVYDDASGSVYKYTPGTRTIGVKVNDNGSLVGGGSLEPGRSLEIQRTVDGIIANPTRVYYPEYVNLFYKTYQYKHNYKHTNRAPLITNGASVVLGDYSVETITSAVGISVTAIINSNTLSYSDPNAEYDNRGLILSAPLTSNITGNWAYRVDGDVLWTTMNFVDDNSQPLYWYIPEKKYTGGVNKDVYIKFLSSTNANGSASLTINAWDRTNNVGPVDGPVADQLIPYSATGAVSAESATIVQTMSKIAYPPYYDNTKGNTYATVTQDSTVNLSFDSTFFNTIGFLDLSGPGPITGVVIEDVSGAGIGSWSWRFQNDLSWNAFNFGAGGFHIKQAVTGENNVLVRFVPQAYKYGTVSFRARLWDGSVDVSNGAYAVVPSVYNPNGSYSATAKTWNVVISDVADGPKLYNASGVEIGETYTTKFITYGKGYTPADDGADAIAVSSILDEFTTTRAFKARLVDVDNGFVDFDRSTLGIIIEDVSGPVDISFQRLVSGTTWRSYTRTDFFDNGIRKYLHLNNNDIFRFVVPNSALGQNLITFRFRIWNRLNVSAPSIIATIAAYNTINTTGPFYSIPIDATVSYDNTNLAPVINVQEASYSYSLGTQGEDVGDSADFDVGEIISNLLNAQRDGQPLITDADGTYITQIPLFGLALCSAPAPNYFPNPGAWKYRADANATAQTLDFNNGFFHVAVEGGASPKIFYSPEKNTFGAIQLIARIWDRSNEKDVSGGMYLQYNGPYNRIAPYSAKTITFQLDITNVNDRPFVVGGRLFLTGISYTNTNPVGQTIYNIMRTNGFVVADPDPQEIGSHGLAIVGLSDPSLGTWQYMLDGVTWINIPTALSKALHLDPLNVNGSADNNVRLRFIPNAGLTRNTTGARVFQFYLWDKTNGVAQGAFQTINPATDTSYSLISYTGRIRVTL